MVIYPPAEYTVKAYVAWCKKRDIAVPPMGKDAIFVGIPNTGPRGGVLPPTMVCGCMLYPTDGPYVFAEHLISNPELPARVVHRAVERLIGVVLVYAATRGKWPWIIPQSRAIATMLERQGFTTNKQYVYVAEPVFGAKRRKRG